MKIVFHKILLLLPVAACFFLCSCATALTVETMGRESFRWHPKEMQVSIRTETDKSFMEYKTVCITKKGRLKTYWMPYDFARKFPSDKSISRQMEIPVRKNLPVFAVKVVKNTKSVVTRHKGGQNSVSDANMNLSFVGFVESVRPANVSPEDFQVLRKPFWYCQNRTWTLCVPIDFIKMGDYYQIPVVQVQPGGEKYLPPDELRYEEIYWNGVGINCARAVCSILPLAFDIATFPVQLIGMIVL